MSYLCSAAVCIPRGVISVAYGFLDHIPPLTGFHLLHLPSYSPVPLLRSDISSSGIWRLSLQKAGFVAWAAGIQHSEEGGTLKPVILPAMLIKRLGFLTEVVDITPLPFFNQLIRRPSVTGYRDQLPAVFALGLVAVA